MHRDCRRAGESSRICLVGQDSSTPGLRRVDRLLAADWKNPYKRKYVHDRGGRKVSNPSCGRRCRVAVARLGGRRRATSDGEVVGEVAMNIGVVVVGEVAVNMGVVVQLVKQML
jgi:hypothetical protein